MPPSSNNPFHVYTVCRATPTAFAETLRRALAVFPNRERWRVIQMQGMRQDFSWENSALEYVKLYQDLILVRA
jgi:starch synthase